MKTEILAPCGSMDSLIAAVRCGANAVYLGTKDMNARRGADNFDSEQLKNATEYAHSHGVKVYVTLNTLVSDAEMQQAHAIVKDALLCGADAFIVQDLGLVKMMRECYPNAKLHASTQCSVNTPDGFRKLEELGFVRAVIPREMSLDEIREIRRCTDMELEIFVHGALCMCVSGQCYLSAMLGERSGNRGLCAQPCRLAFSADNSGSYDLSLKDLSLISHIKEIEDAGVISLKIEGRMKRPEYVAAAVTACKKAIDGGYKSGDEDVLKSVFSRSGFTDGYFTARRKDMFGTRRKEDVVAAGSVLKELSHLYDNEKPLLPIDMEFTCKTGEAVRLTATALGKTVNVTGNVPEKAMNKPMTEESVAARLSKLGGTQFYADSIKVCLDGGLIIPASEINSMRREVVTLLSKDAVQPFECKDYSSRYEIPHRTEKPYYTARFTDASQIPAGHPFRRIFLPIWTSDEDFVKSGAGVEIPRGLFGTESRLKKELTHLREIGVTTALCSNLGAYKTAEELGFKAYGDFGLNIFNSEAARQFNSPVLSFELTLEQAGRIAAEDVGIIGYGKVPLMITRNCPVKNRIGCEKCGKKGVLTDRKGYKFSVKCSSYPCVEILNPLPIYLGDRMHEINTDFVHFYFTDETKEQVLQLVNMYKKQEKYPNKYTRGLYYRGVK
ncbi:MAG: U32 family peptidase [Ruminococcaceae bacterium]|nr:U32 family peptidase [Oscillospiraceae bacterium]